MSPAFDLPPWLAGQWSRLAAMLGAAPPPHALLLHGPSGIGKRRLAERIAGTIPVCRAISRPVRRVPFVSSRERGKPSRLPEDRAGRGKLGHRDRNRARAHRRFQSGGRTLPGRNRLPGGVDEPGGRKCLSEDARGAGRGGGVPPHQRRAGTASRYHSKPVPKDGSAASDPP